MADRTQAYVDAIIEVARGEDALDAVDDELLRVARAIGDDRELHDVLTNQQYPLARRLQVVDEIIEAAHPATRSVVALLVAGGRVRELDDIARRVAERSAEERKKALAEVHVAVELDQTQREELRRALERATGKQLELRIFVDPSVLGGVRAKIGDTVIDGTVARRLDDVRGRLGA